MKFAHVSGWPRRNRSQQPDTWPRMHTERLIWQIVYRAFFSRHGSFVLVTWIIPVSLLASITVTIIVLHFMTETISAASTRPVTRDTGTYVISVKDKVLYGNWRNYVDWLPFFTRETTLVISCSLSCTPSPFWKGIVIEWICSHR